MVSRTTCEFLIAFMNQNTLKKVILIFSGFPRKLASQLLVSTRTRGLGVWMYDLEFGLFGMAPVHIDNKMAI